VAVLERLQCLRADKRRRIQARRAGERAQYAKWLVRTVCPHCGVVYGKSIHVTANSILVVSFAKEQMSEGKDPVSAAVQGMPA
jgi:hypothetical protein